MLSALSVCRTRSWSAPAPARRRTGTARRAAAPERGGDGRCGRGCARSAGQACVGNLAGNAGRISGRWPLAAGRWPLAAGRWPLAAGRWPLAAGRWPLAAGRWPLAAGRWPLAAGRWPLAAGRWPLAIIRHTRVYRGRSQVPMQEPGHNAGSGRRQRLDGHSRIPARGGGRPVSRHTQHGRPSSDPGGDPDIRVVPVVFTGPMRRRSQK